MLLALPTTFGYAEPRLTVPGNHSSTATILPRWSQMVKERITDLADEAGRSRHAQPAPILFAVSTTALVEEYAEAVSKGDSLHAAGSDINAALMHERGGRIAYNNKLKTDSGALDERLATAKKARDEKPTVAAASAPPSAPETAQGPSPKILQEYEEAVQKGDALSKVGNYFDATLEYERAGRIAYANKTIDTSALEKRLAQARKARDEGEEGEEMRFLGLTVPQASTVRAKNPIDVCGHTGICVDGPTEEDSWLIANPYLPGDHRFFDMIYGAACSSDGTLYVAADGIVPAEATRRRPRSNRDWYADNGRGLWRVAPDGRVTSFAVGPYGFYPPPKLKPNPKAFCDASAVEVSPFEPRQWGGIAVAPNGDVFVSNFEHHMILKLRGDGTVEHVAGGGENACAYARWNDKRGEHGYRDGPGKQALFRTPQGLAIDREGNLLVTDWGNCALRRIDPDGTVTTVHRGCYADPQDRKDRRKRINHVHVAVDPQGRPVVGGSLAVPGVNIYSNIHRFHADGRIEQMLSATKGYANSGELGVEYLDGLAFLPDGRLLIADGPNDLLRTADGKRLTDWLGAVSPHESRMDIDGRRPKARLRRPGDLCVTGDGTIFVAPAGPRTGPVRKVDGKTREVSTWVY